MPKRLRLSAREKDDWLGHCGWCNRRMGQEDERIAINARFRTKKITEKMREGWYHLHWRTPAGR